MAIPALPEPTPMSCSHQRESVLKPNKQVYLKLKLSGKYNVINVLLTVTASPET